MNMTSKKWLITGGAGFIGSATARQLLKLGQSVIIYDDFSSSSLRDVKDIKNKIKIIKAGIEDEKALKKAFKGIDFVFHFAAVASVAQSAADPDRTYDINIKGTYNVLTAAKNAGVKRVVFASSAAIYGDSKAPLKESVLPECRSLYATSKFIGEELCKIFYNLHSLETVCLRYFNVFGPAQKVNSEYRSVVDMFLESAKKGDTFSFEWDGRQRRDFLFITDAARAGILAAQKAKPGQSYNVSGGKAYTLLELADIIESVAGKKMKRRFFPKRAGDIRYSAADIRKIGRIGFKPEIDLKRGIKIIWDDTNV
ncbi:nucleoside-diphosphate-sugar epimerase [Elusimicrobium posterum]|uniref:SDR family NAD(P)-dependent oxidoreductase n=1 Tax=Elusimicrobium posterum TaxID=3116653 RepID=UPI003C770FB5